MMKNMQTFAPPASKLADIEAALAGVIKGKAEAIRLSLVCLLSRGHLLIEDVPGVGKTTLAHALAKLTGGGFNRVQFTADMLPSDVLGVTVYNAQTRDFEFKQGPIFTHYLLADEINRATPKTQSALLEAMNERQVSVDGKSYPLGQAFMVIATQNPVEHHGTYPLPESQLDRFFMRIRIGYPDAESEREILRNPAAASLDALRPVLSPDELVALQNTAACVRVDDAIADYVVSIAARTRTHDSLSLGVSPRGAQALFRAAQSKALVEGRDYVIPDDVKELVTPVFAHRLGLKMRAQANRAGGSAAESILQEVLTQVEVPG